MDEFGNILNNATNEANQTYATDTANAANAQSQANAANANVNSEAQSVNQNAAALSALGATDSNQAQNETNFNTAEQDQLNNMGFDKTTLNQADQNIAQETGQLGAANNQMAAQGGTRGFNATGEANRQANVQSNFSNAIAGNTAVQSNELGQANTAATLTGQDMTYQLGQNTNAISAYNNAAQQYNNEMANYASTLSTFATQAVNEGGLVGSNVANIMAAANSAAQAALAPYTAEEEASQANLNNANAANAEQQNAYNAQMEPLQIQAEKTVESNQKTQAAQVTALETDINNEKASEESGAGWSTSSLFGMISQSLHNKSIQSTISGQQAQINQLEGLQSSSAG